MLPGFLGGTSVANQLPTNVMNQGFSGTFTPSGGLQSAQAFNTPSPGGNVINSPGFAVDNIGAMPLPPVSMSVLSAPSGGGGMCFITTAMAEQLGEPDDCEALTTLRRFRDEVMATTPSGKALIAEYYRIAPEIVRSIGDDAEAYAELRDQYISPAVEAVKAGRNDEALELYTGMVVGLSNKYLTKENSDG
jgi:hypothetical protein